MRRFATFAAMAAMVLGGGAALRADDDGDEREDEGRRGRDSRPADDVGVRLAVGRKRGGEAVARLRVRNQGTNPQADVLLEVRADSSSGTLLWTATADLAPGRSVSFRVPLDPPAGTTALVATAALSGAADEDPSDNEATVSLGGGGSPSPGAAARGATLYAANCARCHGADARGSGEAPWIRGEEAEEIAEAIREGEEGMPTFPGLSADDVRALAAYLRNPDAVEPPAPPPPPLPPPPGTSPTYAGQVKSLLDSRCVACHGGRNASAGIRLDSFRTASANASSALAAVEAGRMPQGGPAFTAEEIALLRDWIAGGKQP